MIHGLTTIELNCNKPKVRNPDFTVWNSHEPKMFHLSCGLDII